MRLSKTVFRVPFKPWKRTKRDIAEITRGLPGNEFGLRTNTFLDFATTTVRTETNAVGSYIKKIWRDTFRSYARPGTVTESISRFARRKDEKEKPLKIAVFGKRNIDNLSVVRTVGLLARGSEFQTKDTNDSQNSSYVATFSFQGREVSLVVAPWLQDKDISETTAGEVTRFVLKSLPGLSSVILTLNLNDLSEVPYTVQYYEAVFGKGVLDYSILAFICDSEHANTSRLKHVLEELKNKGYKDRYVVISQGKQDDQKAHQIIKYTDAIMKNNDGIYFRNDTFKKVEETVQRVLLLSSLTTPRVKRKRRRVSSFRTRGTDDYIVHLLLQIRYEQRCIMMLILNKQDTSWQNEMLNNIPSHLLKVITKLIRCYLGYGWIEFGFDYFKSK